MVLASTMAGMGFANTRLTIVHAMSHPVSGFHGVPHGVANAVLLPYVMEFNLIGNAHRFGDVARAMGENTFGLTTMEAARLSVKAVRELNKDVGIPETFESCWYAFCQSSPSGADTRAGNRRMTWSLAP